MGGFGMPGQTYMGSQGTSLNYNNICFAQTEDKLPDGWKPLHMQKVFRPDESAVSIWSGWSLSNVCWFSPMPIHEVIKGWLTHFFSTGNGSATLVLDPTVARDVKSQRFGSKEDESD